MSALEDRVRQQDPENAIISRLARLSKWSTKSRFYGGDIGGIYQKLDYLEELGVTICLLYTSDAADE